LNVLVVSHLWPRADFPHLGIFVADQVAELAKRCQVSVVAPVDLTHRSDEIGPKEILAGLPQYRARAQPAFIPVNEIKPQVVTFRAAPFRQALALATARNLAKALEPIDPAQFDLIHAHTLFPDGLACSLWLKNMSIPLVITAHGSDVHSMPPGVKKALGHLLDRADLMIAVSRSLSESLIRLGARPDIVHVLPNGFAADLFDLPSPPPRVRRKIVFLGRLGAVKRVDLLIRALTHLPPDIHLGIAGDGAERRSLESLVAALRLNQRVRFYGVISRQDIPPFLAGAALMCLISEKEGWPTVIFESLACGTPVLATSVGGIPEALADPGLGMLIPPDISPEKLAAQILTALDKRWDHVAIRRHALNYSWKAISARLFEVYQTLISAKQSSKESSA